MLVGDDRESAFGQRQQLAALQQKIRIAGAAEALVAEGEGLVEEDAAEIGRASCRERV